MSKIKVLLVDDQTIMRDGIRALLKLESNIEVIGEAETGNEAVKKARELSPDVIIMELAIPGIDGIEATRRILKQDPQAKVLVLSQLEDKEHILSSIKAGIAGYMPKRALGSELLLAIIVIARGESFLHPLAAAALIGDYREQARISESYEHLTTAERKVLKLIAEGQTSRKIASTLLMNLKTVTGYRTAIMEKLGLRDNAELVKYAQHTGWLTTT